MAFVPDGVSVVMVVISVNIKASSNNISDVSKVTAVPSSLLIPMTTVSPLSDNTCIMEVSWVLSVKLNRDNPVSVGSRSDGLSSPVEEPPLLDVIWIVVSDSQSSISVTNVLSPDESSSRVHLCLNLESSAISFWISWILNFSKGNGPLSRSVSLAVVEGKSS